MALLIRLPSRLVQACAITLLALFLVDAQAEAPVERQVKAAYLYKFASFVEWPEDAFSKPDAPLQIGVAGNDALADQLEQMVAGRSVNGRPLVVKRIKRGDSLAGLHILYVGGSDRAAMAELLAAARGQAVLTVTDHEAGLAQGSMINFLVADDKLRFEVAMKPVSLSRLRISARMLAAAHRVQQGAPS